MNVLLTGHTGFLGVHTANYFVECGHVVYGVSRSTIPNCTHNQYIIDVCDKDSLAKLTNEKCIDVIVHLAGKPLVADCAIDPFNAFKINGLGTAAILEAARYAKVKKVIVVETDKVYGFQDIVPTTEEAVFNPGSPYELSKVMAAMLCDFYREHYSMDVISVRPVNLFGPGDFSFTRIVPAAMRAIFNNQGIPVQQHAVSIQRNFIYVKDAAKMLYLLATEKPAKSVYNLSTNESISILDFANRVTKILNHVVDPVIVQKPGVYAEIPFQSIDGTRFNNEFNFVFTPFEDAIVETYDEYKKKALSIP